MNKAHILIQITMLLTFCLSANADYDGRNLKESDIDVVKVIKEAASWCAIDPRCISFTGEGLVAYKYSVAKIEVSRNNFLELRKEMEDVANGVREEVKDAFDRGNYFPILIIPAVIEGYDVNNIIIGKTIEINDKVSCNAFISIDIGYQVQNLTKVVVDNCKLLATSEDTVDYQFGIERVDLTRLYSGKDY